MVGGKRWCFGNQSSGDDVADFDPILLVSGIGGTILNSKLKSCFGLTTRIWVRILLADMEFRKRAWSLYNPDTGSFSFSIKSFLLYTLIYNLYIMALICQTFHKLYYQDGIFVC